MSLLEKIKSALGMDGAESESTGGNTRSTGKSGVTVERETDSKTETDTETDTDTDIDEIQTEVDEETEVADGDGEIEGEGEKEEGKSEAEDEGEAEGEEGEDDEGETAEGEQEEEDEEENLQSPEVSGTMVDTDAGVETGEVAGQADTQTGPADEPGEAAGPTSTDGPGPATGQSEEVPETDTGDVEGGEGVETEDPSTDEADPDTGEPNSESEPVDVIKGVGATYAETLNEKGIESVDDLASADPETLAEETGISPKRIERWIGRAQHR